ncbi:hypothetical protein Syun_026017 [Stephania yunnanensis]|uniref:Uncharacterized protein n=1 Tax=Stephania yunnanensis TaxID=152371 RepID=A0AAP0EY46_9MAGN
MGRSSVERDHGERKKEGTRVRSSEEGGEECTDATEKEERRLWVHRSEEQRLWYVE